MSNMNPLSCDEVREEFAAFDREELSAELRTAVESHLASCAACREVRELDARIDEMLQEEPLVLAAPGFEKELYHRLETEREAPRTAKIHYFSKRNIAAAAAVLFVIFGIVKFIKTGREDDSDVIANLDVLEPLAALRDQMTPAESALILQLTKIKNPTLDTLLRAEDEDGF